VKVDIVDLVDIEFGNRQREDYGDLAELAHSIKLKGVICPMAVKRQREGLPYLLIAGGRRHKACQVAGLSKVPVRIYDRDLTDLDFREIELFENIHRKDLEWQERVNQERDIHNLQIEKFGEKISTDPDAPGHSIKDTADLIGKSGEHVRTSIMLANANEKFPELFEGCKNKADATKVVKALGVQVVQDEIIKRIKEEKGDVKKGSLADNFILESFFHGVTKIEPETINLVEIDPPYAIDLLNAKKSENNKGHQYGDSYNEIDIKDYPKFMRQTLKACYKVMAKDSWLICWFAPEPWAEHMFNWIIEAGFMTHRMCGIWAKPSGQNKRPELRLANSYEMFYYASKGRPAIAQAHSNIFDNKPVSASKKTHPTERPIELMSDIYSTFTWPGSHILIPFLGSGNGILSAREVNMSAIGYELGRDFKDSFLIKLHNS